MTREGFTEQANIRAGQPKTDFILRITIATEMWIKCHVKIP